MLIVVALLLQGQTAAAQDLEPRRWTHLPTGLNVIGLGVGYGSGDISLDPVLEIENGEVEIASAALAYVRSFGLFGRSARVDVLMPYATGRWSGRLQGAPASVRRAGFSDPRVRLSMLLYGAPAQDPKTFASTPKSNTVIGAALSLRLPWGEYFPDKLINLGANRWVLRPQLGVTHTRGRWTGELTGSVFWYGDNDDFRNDNRLSNDVLYALQAHLIYQLKPGVWMSFSTAYGDGAEVEINGVSRGNKAENWLNALSLGLPLSRTQGIKISWIRTRTMIDTGADTDSLALSWNTVF